MLSIFQEKLSLFIFSSDYLKYNLTTWLLLVYLGRFLTTFFYYPVAGALLISLIIFLIIYMISKIITILTGQIINSSSSSFQEPYFLSCRLITSILFITTLEYFCSLSCFMVIKYLKGFLPVILFPFWYFITGGFAWIFALMYTLYLILKSLRKEWPKIISLFAFSFIVIYLLKEFFLFQPFKSLLIFPFSDEDTGITIQYCLVSLICL